MNLVGILIGTVAVLVILGAILRYMGKKIWISVLYMIGLALLAVGIYLIPASMWRGIGVVFIIMGISLEVIAIWLTRKENNIEKH